MSLERFSPLKAIHALPPPGLLSAPLGRTLRFKALDSIGVPSTLK